MTFGEVRQRSPRWECKALTDSARAKPCRGCGRNDGTTVAAHGNEGIMGKGFGLKSHDILTARLRGDCHRYVDRQALADPTGVWGDTEAERRGYWFRAHVLTLIDLAMEGWIRPPGKR